MSVARTRPLAPTRSESQRAMLPPPAPISRQCQPFATPRSQRCRIVPGSKIAANASNRAGASAPALSNT